MLLDTMLNYYGVATDTDKLTDDEWCAKVAMLLKIRRLEAESNGSRASEIIQLFKK